MKVTVIPIVIGALSTVTKWMVQGLEDLEVTANAGAKNSKGVNNN